MLVWGKSPYPFIEEKCERIKKLKKKLKNYIEKLTLL